MLHLWAFSTINHSLGNMQGIVNYDNMSPFQRQWQARELTVRAVKDVELEGWARWQAQMVCRVSQTEKSLLARAASCDKGATQSICILFLQRGFKPKKERDFSVVTQALFGVKSRRKSADGAFLKALVSALRLFSSRQVLEGCLHTIVCLKIFSTQRAPSIPFCWHKRKKFVW